MESLGERMGKIILPLRHEFPLIAKTQHFHASQVAFSVIILYFPKIHKKNSRLLPKKKYPGLLSGVLDV